MNASSSIKKLSLILPDEADKMELVVFHRLENVVNEGMITNFSLLLEEKNGDMYVRF